MKGRKETHGKSKIPEYRTWVSMKARCYNPNNSGYKKYGGKGLGVCEKWVNDFGQFFIDMGKKPTKKHSLDRINGRLGYSKENCKWSTPQEQAQNTTKTRWISYDGVTMCLSEWAEYFNMTTGKLGYLLKKQDISELYKKYNSRIDNNDNEAVNSGNG